MDIDVNGNVKFYTHGRKYHVCQNYNFHMGKSEKNPTIMYLNSCLSHWSQNLKRDKV